MKVKKCFCEKGKILRKSENFYEIGGKSETGGKMHHGLMGDGRPCFTDRIDIQLNGGRRYNEL